MIGIEAMSDGMPTSRDKPNSGIGRFEAGGYRRLLPQVTEVLE